MSKVLGPVRFLRSRRTSFQNTAETQELDFNLGVRQGVEIFAAEFGIRNVVPVPGDDAIVITNAHMSLHIETGALEGGIESFPADETILNSEIIAETTLQVQAFTSSVPAASPDVFNMIWLQPLSWNYIQLLGKPLIIAQNATFRGVTSASTLTVNGGQITIMYRYIELTKEELGEQFILRR